MIGRHLVSMLRQEGFVPLVLTRGKTEPPNYFHWNVKEKVMSREACEGVSHIIHLAGAGIADERWSRHRKKEIIESRVESARLLFEYCQDSNNRPVSFISASAIGIYGDTGDEWVREDHPVGEGFLSEVCRQWEEAADAFEPLGMRVAKLRTGLVLSRAGGILPKMLLPLKLGMAPYFGDGKQYYSWVHIEDVCRGYLHLLKNNSLSGAYNMTAPHPVRNKEFVETLKQISGKRAISFGIPKAGLRVMFGEMSKALTMSNRICSEKIQNSGFEFKYKSLESALENLLH